MTNDASTVTALPTNTTPRDRPIPRERLRVFVLTNLWPRPDNPECGVMVVRQMASLPRVDVDVDVLPISGGVRSYFRAAVRIVRMNFGRRKYDVIHAHTGHCGLLACLQVRYPIVLSYVGYDLDTPAEHKEGRRTRLERRIFRQLSRFVAATIAKSNRGRSHLPPAALDRTALLPNGVDRALFAPMQREDARRRLRWPDVPVALFAGDPSRFTKNFALAQTAFEQARKRVPDLRLLVCSRVPPNDVPLWMNAADVLLLTSVAEGSPNVVKEAMACDLPIVAVDVGDVREIVEGTRHCHVCTHDPAALATAVVAVIESDCPRSDGRSRSEHLDLHEIALRLRTVYDRATERGPGPFGFVHLRPARSVPSR